MSARDRDFSPVLLALRALGLGDLLTIVPAWRALERAFPGYRRRLATPRALAPIVDLLGAEHAPTPDLGVRPEAQVDVAVNLHGRGPESHRCLLARRPVRLISFAHPELPCTRGAPQWDADEHEIARWCRVLNEHHIPADPSELDLAPPARHLPAIAALAGDVGDETTLLHPGAGAPARRWPVERFAEIARHERDAGRRVLVTGGGSEQLLARRLVRDAGLGSSANLAGRTDVGTLAALVWRAGRVVCGDTGIAHLATALRTPSVVLFGPTTPARWGPPADRPWHRVLWAGQTGDPHGSVADPGLLAVGTAEVVDALACLPPSPRGRSGLRPLAITASGRLQGRG
jgi:ADP-heptose:LPS heptosyltransferase